MYNLKLGSARLHWKEMKVPRAASVDVNAGGSDDPSFRCSRVRADVMSERGQRERERENLENYL